MLSGHLIPLSPVIHQNQGDSRKAALKPLAIPGSFGREDLLRPFANACPTCRRRRTSTSTRPAPPKKKNRPAPSPSCRVCVSIQALAAFVPRKDFWRFARRGSADDGGESVLLTISGTNSSRLVRVCSSRGDARKSLRPQEDPQQVVVYDRDTVSLLWYNNQKGNGGEGAMQASSTLEPLVRFRVVLAKGEDAFESAVGNALSGNRDGVSLLTTTTTDPFEKKDGQNLIDTVGCDTNKTQNNDYHDAKINLPEENTEEDAACNNNIHYHYKRNKTCDDEDDEPESAPLTLPSQFTTSDSKSFCLDSPEKSPPRHSTSAVNNAADARQNRDTNGTQLSKQMDDDTKAGGDATEATKTPKKSNVTDAGTAASVPLSAVSHDRLVRLHAETAPTRSAEPPSLRHAVLALTLRLTSDASAWDAHFLQRCASGAPAKDGGIRGAREGVPPPVKQRWMPRLLQGTHIQLPKKSASGGA